MIGKRAGLTFMMLVCISFNATSKTQKNAEITASRVPAAAQDSGSCHTLYPEGYYEDAYFIICLQYFGERNAKLRYAKLDSISAGGGVSVVDCGRSEQTANQDGWEMYLKLSNKSLYWENRGIHGSIKIQSSYVYRDGETQFDTYLTKRFEQQDRYWNTKKEQELIEKMNTAFIERDCRE